MTAETLCFERLQVMQDEIPRDAALNMALDEVLLNGLVGAPLLRFYRWAEPAVSFGYFEPVAAARSLARGRGIVRRLTGGGIVEHGDDLTFTLAVPRADAFTRLRSAESYRRIHSALARALERCGLVSQTHDEAPSKFADDERPNACFGRPVLHDLMADGQKVAGGAQRRNRIGLLHQGSVHPGPAPGRSWKDRLRLELPRALSCVCESQTLTPVEIARAEEIAATRYASSAWTNRV